jgi:serine protease inhibitor
MKPLSAKPATPTTTLKPTTNESTPKVGSPALTKDQVLTKMLGAYDKFQHDFLTKVLLGSKTNGALSPASAFAVLMMRLASGGQSTQAAIIQALGLKGLSTEAVLAGGQALITYFTELAKDTGVTLNTSNIAAIKEGNAFPPELLNTLKKYMPNFSDATFKNGDPSKLNKIVEKDTQGEIKDFLKPSDIDGASSLLINTLYMNAPWQDAFNKDLNYEGNYYADGKPAENNPSKEEKKVTYMCKKGNFKISQTANGTAVILPYGKSKNGKQLIMTLMLPNEGKTTADNKELFGKDLNALLKKAKEQEATLSLPKFKISARTDITATLGSMGYPMGQDKILTQVNTTVDNNGTIAAAATASVGRGITPQLTFNKPFSWVVSDTQGHALFGGNTHTID